MAARRMLLWPGIQGWMIVVLRLTRLKESGGGSYRLEPAEAADSVRALTIGGGKLISATRQSSDHSGGKLISALPSEL